tara:strand:- start:26751 stop:28121 length:1371 start_codon:yes stop_codon:yes gene_type:complete
MKVNKICCIGAGYVGGPTMAVIALKCPEIQITVVDVNKDKINSWNGPLDQLPVFEPGLDQVIKQVRGRNLFFSADIDNSIFDSQMIFMAVNTPTKTSGEGAGMAADLKYVEECAKKIAEVSRSDKIIVEKSTLPVRTAEKIKEIIYKHRSNDVNFDIISNPEFLAEGTAIEDLFKSDRVLIGGDESFSGQRAVSALVEIYSKWIPKEKILTTNIWSSELAKLASNAMLAQRISSINSLSALCEKTGANIEELSRAIGMDNRIGPEFLKASVGFGGSCFKKDILNLVYLSKYYGLDDVADYWLQVLKINDYQKDRFTKKIISSFKNIRDKKVLVLGWAFKANTGDSRDSAAIYVAYNLICSGARVYIYDPVVSKAQILSDLNFLFKEDNISDVQKTIFSEKLFIINSFECEINSSDAIAIITEWDEFRDFDWNKVTKKPLIFDGRGILKDFYYSIGK